MEILDLYNSRKEKINKEWVREEGEPPSQTFQTHVHVWVINAKGELLIQKRVKTRKVHPNLWSFTGGAVDKGETSYEGARRELKEELGLDIKELELLITFRREHDFVDVWIGRSDISLDELKLSEHEVSEVKWVSLEALKSLKQQEKFVPALNLYYDLLEQLLKKLYL